LSIFHLVNILILLVGQYGYIGPFAPVAVALLVIAVALGIWLRAPLPPTLSGSRAITNDGMQKVAGALVTDGSRIYLTETDGTRFWIAQVSSSGGETGNVDVPIANPTLQDVSPGSDGAIDFAGNGGFD
jgi:hypothetical protein